MSPDNLKNSARGETAANLLEGVDLAVEEGDLHFAYGLLKMHSSLYGGDALGLGKANREMQDFSLTLKGHIDQIGDAVRKHYTETGHGIAIEGKEG